ncbi:unnamed protein product [Candidula unifasciata]|uniref:Uncharacterized protein n=1 Tax=Candidula unifasciata TaxID=100452 RepID=A0A8S3YL71_9EUPU|nr:unnamed protein product [Candidula unifasciata]
MRDSDAKDYQLWVVAGKENSPYPLIGHETPYSIKYNQARELSRSRSANDLDNMTALDLDTIVENISVSGSKCEFYLKQKQSPRNGQFDSPHHKPMKKHKKTQNIFNTIFRKKRVFGIPLAKICDKNLDPPEGIIKLMVQVYQHGPQTSGILRRGNNALLGKEIKEKINAGDKYHLEDHMTPTAASVNHIS